MNLKMNLLNARAEFRRSPPILVELIFAAQAIASAFWCYRGYHEHSPFWFALTHEWPQHMWFDVTVGTTLLFAFCGLWQMVATILLHTRASRMAAAGFAVALWFGIWWISRQAMVPTWFAVAAVIACVAQVIVFFKVR